MAELVVHNLKVSQTLTKVRFTYWLTSIDWTKSPHVEPAKGKRRTLHPFHPSWRKH